MNRGRLKHFVRFLRSESHFNIENKRIADFGCGPGLYTTKLAQRKANVVGIDFSKRSIRYAQEVADKERLSIQYVNQNYLEYETDNRFDLVLMIMCDFCALSPSQRNKMLNKFHTMLASGGSVLLDVYSLTAFEEREETSNYELNQLNGFWSPDDYYCFVNTFKYDEEKVTLDKYTIVEEAGTRIVYNWLQHFSKESLQDEFTANDFKVEGIYSDVAGTPFNSESSEIAVVGSKWPSK